MTSATVGLGMVVADKQSRENLNNFPTQGIYSSACYSY